MRNFEKSAYARLGPEGRETFRELFWAHRGPGSRLEFGARLRQVAVAFQRENALRPWATDRGRIFLLNGSPVAIDYADDESWANPEARGDVSLDDIAALRGETWTYVFGASSVLYSFVFLKPNEWRLVDRMSGNWDRAGLEAWSRDVTFGITDLEAYQAALAELR
jgi:GWxTD domain-containing protein